MSTMTHPDLGPFPEVAGYDEALRLDAADALAGYRAHYVHSDPDLVYLDGNSLGRLPAAATSIVEEVTKDQWGDRLIRSWNEGWWDLQLRLGDLLAPIVGARPGEVMISDSTSVNLYKLAHAAVTSMPTDRDVIVTDDLNFPSDVYILQSVADQTGRSLQILPSDGIHGPVEALADTIDERTALVSLSHTVFQSGYTYDLTEMTRLAQDAGAMMLWDCSHSVGAVPTDFSAAGVELAVGCTYKHLNGGPGSPAFLYVRQDLHERLTNPIAGWWGHEAPFDLDLDYRPTEGIRRFHVGTMPILSLAAVEAGLADVASATVTAIRAKSVALGEYLVDQVDQHLAPLGFELASPSDPEHRGSHVSLRHEHAWPIDVALIERWKVIPDFRAPDKLRLGLAPLYNTFLDVHTAVQRIVQVVTTGAYKEFTGFASKVT
jgi:kynureninase